MKKLLCAAAALALSAGAANAAIIPVLDSVTPDAGLYLFNYSATLAPDAGVVAGDKLVIFDFAGFTKFGDLGPNIVGTTELSTPTVLGGGTIYPPPPGFNDDPTVANLVFTYTGPDFQTSGGPYPAIDFNLSAYSTFQNVRLDGFSAVTVKNNGAAVGTPIYDVGVTAVAAPGAVPEPASWALMIAGFGGAGYMLRRRKTQALAA